MIAPYGKLSRKVAASLKPMARALLLTIACCINRKSNELSISLNQLAEEAGMGVDTVIKWTATLEKAGYLKVTRSKGGKHNDVNIYRLAGEAADTALWNQAAENSETNASKKSRAGVENSERFLNVVNESSDDDENISESDSGEFSFQNEGQDEQRDQADASRKYLEERGVKASALAEASQHPLEALQRAFALAEQHGASNRPAYALSVLKNGEFAPKPAWMNAPVQDSSPSPSASLRAQWGRSAVTSRRRVGQGGGVSFAKSSAVKTNFHNSPSNPFAGRLWSDFSGENRCSECAYLPYACQCKKEVKTHA